MWETLILVGILVLWIVISRFLFPKMGVPV